MNGEKPNISCTHSWKTCPVHGLPDGELPPWKTVLTCIYGGAELKDGGTWDETTSAEVTERMVKRLDNFVESGGPAKIGKAIAAAIEVRKMNDAGK